MPTDLLLGSLWECTSSAPGRAQTDDELGKLELDWVPAAVPGTAAGAMGRQVGLSADSFDYDRRDWWFRTSFLAGGESGVLHLGGLATIADVWLNGAHLLHSENMFVAHEVPVTTTTGPNHLTIRFGALDERLAPRRPRPRWRALAVQPGLRWIRTSMIGRASGWTLTPPIVGPWREVSLRPDTVPRVRARRVRARCDGPDGVIDLEIHLTADPSIHEATVTAGSVTAPLEVHQAADEVVLSGHVRIPDAERWWPRTHGRPTRYEVAVTTDGVLSELPLGHVGFRTLDVDRSNGAFQFVVNGQPIFCRGASWWPVDPVSLTSTDDEIRAMLERAARGHLNMIRVSGMAVYEGDAFFDICDELGLLVWQDLMLAFNDPPDEADFIDSFIEEIRQNLSPLGQHCSVALVCGSLQIEETAALMGLPADGYTCPLVDQIVPWVVAEVLPGVPYLPSCPTEGTLPNYVHVGPSNYYGVGMYLRPPEDARQSGVRFASECLFMATPPDPRTIDELCGGTLVASHSPRWKQATHRDPGRSWDMDDLREYYAEQLFGVDLRMVRYEDPDRALEYGRAANAHLVDRVFSQWRRSGSECAGGLVLGLMDQRPGPGWGLIDSAGRPKSTWYALARVSAPTALLMTDEGLAGLACHVVHDGSWPFSGRLALDVFAASGVALEHGEAVVSLPAHSSRSWSEAVLLGGFRDLNRAYRFGPAKHDVTVATLTDEHGEQLGQVFDFPGGMDRPAEADLGIRAEVVPEDDGTWWLHIETRRLCQWVVPILDGYTPTDAWFHLGPGAGRRIRLLGDGGLTVGPPRGVVRAFNSPTAYPVVVPR